jgi:hypothetical protein
MKNIGECQRPVNGLSNLKDGIVGDGQVFTEGEGGIGEEHLAFKWMVEVLD